MSTTAPSSTAKQLCLRLTADCIIYNVLILFHIVSWHLWCNVYDEAVCIWATCQLQYSGMGILILMLTINLLTLLTLTVTLMWQKLPLCDKAQHLHIMAIHLTLLWQYLCGSLWQCWQAVSCPYTSLDSIIIWTWPNTVHFNMYILREVTDFDIQGIYKFKKTFWHCNIYFV